MYCLATPAAVEYLLDVPALTALTGHPVRTTYRTSEDESLPRADAVVVAPATYNAINKWAAGIADNRQLRAQPTRRADRAEGTHRGAAVRQPRAGSQPRVGPQRRTTTQGRRARPVRARRIRTTPAAHGRHCARQFPVGSGPCNRKKITTLESVGSKEDQPAIRCNVVRCSVVLLISSTRTGSSGVDR